jgi:hypothetical protein
MRHFLKVTGDVLYVIGFAAGAAAIYFMLFQGTGEKGGIYVHQED